MRRPVPFITKGWKAFQLICEFVHWALERRLPAREFGSAARIIMACFVVLAAVLASMNTMNGWMHFFHDPAHTALPAPHAPPAAPAEYGPPVPEDPAGPPPAHSNPAGAPQAARSSSGLSPLEAWAGYRWPIFFSCLTVLLIHLGYWTLLSQDLVFSRHVERVRIGTLLIPSALIVGYFLAFADRHVASGAVFAGVYAVLLLEEIGQDSSGVLRSTRLRNFVWIAIDLLLVVGLAYCLAEYVYTEYANQTGRTPILDQTYLHTIGMKDAIIAVNLLGYGFAFFLNRNIDPSLNVLYRVIVRNIVTPVPLPSPAAAAPAGQQPAPAPVLAAGAARPGTHPSSLSAGAPLQCPNLIAKIPALRRKAAAGKRLTVVDFGCGDGSRSLSMLQCLGVAPEKIKRFVGIDRDESWRTGFHDVCQKGHATSHAWTPIQAEFHSRIAQARRVLPKADILIASHVFHDERLVREFAEAVRRAPNAVVLVAGCAPYHFLTGVIAEAAIEGLVPHPYYRWELSHLEEFVRDADLTVVPRKRADLLHFPVAAKGDFPDPTKIVFYFGVIFAGFATPGVLLATGPWFVWSLVFASLGVLLALGWAIYRFRRLRRLRRHDPHAEDHDADFPTYPPFAVISRRFIINDETASAFVQWMEMQYPYRFALRHYWRLKRYLTLMKTHPDVNILSFHDVVYCFNRRRTAVPDPSPAPGPNPQKADATQPMDPVADDVPPPPVAELVPAATGSNGSN